MPTNLEVLRDACIEEISTLDDFWLLAAITDWSYEEGSSSGFKKSVEAYGRDGMAQATLESLLLGTNGNLKAILERRNRAMGTVTRIKNKGQDLSFHAWAQGSAAKIEVKLVFDCTGQDYYCRVAKDWNKLERVRAHGFKGDLFLVVFFVQMPNYVYPAGQWQGLNSTSHPRSKHLAKGKVLINAQYAYLSQHLKHAPVWPENQPLVRALDPADPVTAAALLKRFARFWPATPWSFDTSVHLSDAAVGVAIWQIP